MSHWLLLSSLIIIPAVAGLLSQFFSTQWKILVTSVSGVLITALFGCYAIFTTFSQGPIFGFSGWLFMDALSAYNLGVMLLVFCFSSLFSLDYFGEELREGRLNLRQVQTFAGLWAPAMSSMTLVLISNNLGLMWVGMETTTLLTSFLISIHLTRGSLEAMWKYMLICSVGIAFAFLGTLMIRMAAKDLPLDPNQALLWTNLMAHTPSLAPALVKGAFIFVLVGYGTKAGLAPMHTWLPDAHSKAPSPVSAMFSGFMLNTALYCIMRYVPIVEATLGHTGWSLKLLTGFGLFSILISAAFVLFQHDLKRLLAYSTVEHLGIIALGYGLGGLGTFAALFHTLNHSLCKPLCFFAAGRLGQIFGTHEMNRMAGSYHVSRLWGLGIFAGLLALIGVAPFSIFLSEFLILKAAVDSGKILVVILFLLGATTVFIGILGHSLPLTWGNPGELAESVPTSKLDIFLVVTPLLLLLVLGLWMPEFLQSAIRQASAIIQDTQNLAVPARSSGGGF